MIIFRLAIEYHTPKKKWKIGLLLLQHQDKNVNVREGEGEGTGKGKGKFTLLSPDYLNDRILSEILFSVILIVDILLMKQTIIN